MKYVGQICFGAFLLPRVLFTSAFSARASSRTRCEAADPSVFWKHPEHNALHYWFTSRNMIPLFSCSRPLQ